MSVLYVLDHRPQEWVFVDRRSVHHAATSACTLGTVGPVVRMPASTMPDTAALCAEPNCWGIRW